MPKPLSRPHLLCLLQQVLEIQQDGLIRVTRVDEGAGHTCRASTAVFAFFYALTTTKHLSKYTNVQVSCGTCDGEGAGHTCRARTAVFAIFYAFDDRKVPMKAHKCTTELVCWVFNF